MTMTMSNFWLELLKLLICTNFFYFNPFYSDYNKLKIFRDYRYGRIEQRDDIDIN